MVNRTNLQHRSGGRPNRKSRIESSIGKKESAMKAMLSLLAFLFALSAAAPDVAAQQTASPANPLPATYVSAADIQANLNAALNSATNPLPNIRVVDAGDTTLPSA